MTINFLFLTCPCYAISLRKAGSILHPIPQRVKTQGTGAGGAGLLKQQPHKLNAHKGKKQCESTLEGQGES